MLADTPSISTNDLTDIVARMCEMSGIPEADEWRSELRDILVEAGIDEISSRADIDATCAAIDEALRVGEGEFEEYKTMLRLRPAIREVMIVRLRLDSSNEAEEMTPKLELPAVAPELYKDRADKKETIVDFLRRVWQPWMEAKVLTRRDLRKLDPSADKAVENWLLRQPLPDDISLPTLKEVNDELLAESSDEAVRAAWRLSGLKGRRQRQSGG